MVDNKDLTVNFLPSPTWNRLGVNRAKIRNIPVDGWNSIPVQKEIIEKYTNISDSKIRDSFANIQTGMGEEIDEISKISQPEKIRISADKTKSEKLFFNCKNGENAFADVELYAPENTELTVFMAMQSAWNANGICAVRTKFKAEKGAKIRLVQLNLLSQNFRFINDVGAECEDNAAAEILQLFIGGNETYTGTKATLLGRQSNLDLNVGYYCKDDQLLDMNYVAEHIGKKTVSSMNAGGVLRDKAHKLFRGTIDFPLGSSGAKGDENEDVLILGEDVINQTVPLILCAEEDVEGNHGASIGRPSDDVLFYLASRGLDEEEACNLMARAKLDALCSKIGDEELETLAKSCLEEVTGYANEKL